MPYPTNDEIKAIVSTLFGGGSLVSTEGHDSVLADDFEGSVAGRHLSLDASNVVGKKAWIDQVVTPMRNAHDVTKPAGLSVIRVISSGDGWYAIETLGTGTSRAGKKWHNEAVTLARFTEDKKWVEGKLFLDQQHIQKHLDEA